MPHYTARQAPWPGLGDAQIAEKGCPRFSAKAVGWITLFRFPDLFPTIACRPRYLVGDTPRIGLYWVSTCFSQTHDRSHIMGKAKESSKEAKKKPLKNAKEKKAAKQAKKHASDVVPLLTPH